MTLPTTGTLGMNQVNLEILRPETAELGLDDPAVRVLAGSSTGSVQFASLRGKTYLFTFTISTNQIDADLRSLALAAGWNGVFPVQATINSGVWISGSVAGNSTAALTISGSFPNGITLINNGAIVGRGGNGGSASVAGTAGGKALLASSAVTIQNNGTIAGGGGGGGGGRPGSGTSRECDMGNDSCSGGTGGGGGGGGGRSNISFNAPGGSGGSSSSGGSCLSVLSGSSGGIGTSTAPGSGGAAGYASACRCPGCAGSGGAGGAAGDWGTAGNAGGNGYSGFTTLIGALGGAAGQAVDGNANITWTAFGTRLGPIV